MVDVNHPIRMCEGDNMFNDAHTLEFEISDLTGNPAVFSSLLIIFEFETVDRFNPRHQPPDDFKKIKEVVEQTSRNLFHLPDPYYKGVF